MQGGPQAGELPRIAGLRVERCWGCWGIMVPVCGYLRPHSGHLRGWLRVVSSGLNAGVPSVMGVRKWLCWHGAGVGTLCVWGLGMRCSRFGF